MLLLLLLLLLLVCRNFLLFSTINLLRSFSILSTEYWRVLWMGLRLLRAFLWFSLLLKLPLVDAVGDICNDGDEAVWGDESEVISPVSGIKRKKKKLVKALIEVKVVPVLRNDQLES